MFSEMNSGMPWVQMPVKLPPILHPKIQRLLLGEPERLLGLVNAHGSPVNLIWPDVMRANIDAFRMVLDGRRIAHQIFYGCKVNKSRSLLRSAVEAGIGVDVSSLYEMKDAIEMGLSTDLICGTGPAKNRELRLNFQVQHPIPI